jgi:uncharacterized protein (UPF0297 family)
MFQKKTIAQFQESHGLKSVKDLDKDWKKWDELVEAVLKYEIKSRGYDAVRVRLRRLYNEKKGYNPLNRIK